MQQPARRRRRRRRPPVVFVKREQTPLDRLHAIAARYNLEVDPL